jgi:hypothetical protein
VADAIFGSWTHRRADAGGTRSLAADLGRVKPRVAWTWEPPAGARIDQVRTSGGHVYAAAMGSSEVPGWEHASVFAIDASNGRLTARRSLPDPVPVAALVLEESRIHAVATRPSEPVFWYALSTPDLRPLHRVATPIDGARHTDVLDAWALADGGLWLELETGDGLGGYVSLAETEAEGEDSESTRRAPFRAAVGGLPGARDACESGRSLFAPTDPLTESAGGPRDALVKLEPERSSVAERRTRPRRAMWGRLDPELRTSRSHALSAEGVVYAAAFGDAGRGIFAQVIALDRTSGVERWKTPVSRFPSSGPGSATKLAHWNGEIVMQRLGADGVPCSDLIFAGRRGAFETATLGTGRRFVLDASLGSSLLAHRSKADGSVLVAGFSADGHGGLLGRRARMEFSLETPDVGGEPAVYAGAGKILVKGARRLVAIAL